MRFPPHFSILVLGYGVDRVQTCEACRPAVVARFAADPLLATLLLCLPLLVLVLAAFVRHRRAP